MISRRRPAPQPRRRPRGRGCLRSWSGQGLPAVGAAPALRWQLCACHGRRGAPASVPRWCADRPTGVSSAPPAARRPTWESACGWKCPRTAFASPARGCGQPQGHSQEGAPGTGAGCPGPHPRNRGRAPPGAPPCLRPSHCAARAGPHFWTAARGLQAWLSAGSLLRCQRSQRAHHGAPYRRARSQAAALLVLVRLAGHRPHSACLPMLCLVWCRWYFLRLLSA
mmetsp:Transcript_84794/g.240508  ORF Transcript_84794/g.240508 Transcript_84794/m.240508 type:complete len:224 (-) Transcript_84794:697-1368(-)